MREREGPLQETLFILKQARRFGTKAGDVYQVTEASVLSSVVMSAIHDCELLPAPRAMLEKWHGTSNAFT